LQGHRTITNQQKEQAEALISGGRLSDNSNAV